MQKWFATTAAAGNKSIANSEDRMTLRVEFAAETEARFIVLGFGTDVEVIEPKELRQWVHAEARSISEQAISQSVED